MKSRKSPKKLATKPFPIILSILVIFLFITLTFGLTRLRLRSSYSAVLPSPPATSPLLIDWQVYSNHRCDDTKGRYYFTIGLPLDWTTQSTVTEAAASQQTYTFSKETDSIVIRCGAIEPKLSCNPQPIQFGTHGFTGCQEKLAETTKYTLLMPQTNLGNFTLEATIQSPQLIEAIMTSFALSPTWFATNPLKTLAFDYNDALYDYQHNQEKAALLSKSSPSLRQTLEESDLDAYIKAKMTSKETSPLVSTFSDNANGSFNPNIINISSSDEFSQGLIRYLKLSVYYNNNRFLINDFNTSIHKYK